MNISKEVALIREHRKLRKELKHKIQDRYDKLNIKLEDIKNPKKYRQDKVKKDIKKLEKEIKDVKNNAKELDVKLIPYINKIKLEQRKGDLI